MSRKHAPNLTKAEMEKILFEQDTGVLALNDHDWPYSTPVSYAFIDGNIVIHGANVGHKLDLAKADPRACFVVSRNPDPTRPHQIEGGCTFRFESVICFGRANPILALTERLEWLRRFKAFFDKKLGSDPQADPVTEKAAENCSCIVMRIEKMTGRHKKKALPDS